MNIFFDLEIKFSDRWPNLSPEKRKIFDELKKFIAQRLNVLKEEIELEEVRNNAFTVYFLMETPMYLSFHRFSEYLQNKMSSCFTQEDMDYICIKLLA